MENKLNHPFRLRTRMSVCNLSKLNSIIDSSSHGGVTPSYLGIESFEEGILNDVANWNQTLGLIAHLPGTIESTIGVGILGSLVFAGDPGDRKSVV